MGALARSLVTAVGVGLAACALQPWPAEGSVVDGHHLGPPKTVDFEEAEAAVRRVAEGELRWFEEIYLGPDGTPLLMRPGGLARPVGLAVVRVDDGSFRAFSVVCGPHGCVVRRPPP